MRVVHPLRARITNRGTSTRVDVYDDVGDSGWGDGVTAKAFAGELAGAKGALEVHVNSPGGNVWDGIAIASALRSHKGPVSVIVDGIAASIASVIVQAGAERVMMPGSMMMIHEASCVDGGNAAELRKTAQTMDEISANLAEQYAARGGGTAAEWRAKMQEETWFTAEQAVEAGLADRIGEGDAHLAAPIDLTAYAAVPGEVAARLKAMPVTPRPGPAAGMPGLRLTDEDIDRIVARLGGAVPRGAAGDTPIGDGWVMEPNGSTRFDPDGDGDDDATPEGDTDHDYFDADGNQIKDIPPCPAVPAAKIKGKKGKKAKNAGVDNTPWDAAKAWHNGTTAEDPAAFYAGICAGKKTGDPDTQAAWALPYRYRPDDPPNAAGVRNALARLPQTQGLINKEEARKTLQAAMRDINPGYDADENHLDAGLLSAVLSGALEGGIK